MNKYKVKITEKLVRVIEIEAACELQALAKVEDDYNDGKIILTADNYTDTEFEVELCQDIS